MSSSRSEPVGTFRCAALSVIKHAYVASGVAAPPGFELVVVADDERVPGWAHGRNASFAAEYGIPYLRNVEQALSDFDVDVAIVSSEAERHCDLSVRAANAGCHVVQDKPMSTSLSECDRLVEAVERNGVRFLMWNRNRLPALLHARDTIKSDAIGSLYAVHVDFYFAKDSGPPKGTRQPGDPPINWLQRQIEAHEDGSDGGVGQQPMGELSVEGIYPLAYIHMLTGCKVERVFARTSAHFHQAHFDNQVEDLASVTLEMENGLLGSLCIGRIGAASHPDIGEIKIHLLGSKGALVFSEARPEVSRYYRNQPPTEFRNLRMANENDFWLVDEFASSIDTGRDTSLSADVSRSICATVLAAIESGKTGKLVAVQ